MEKAENALNRRIEEFQAKLQLTESEAPRRYLVQAIFVCVGMGESVTHYVSSISDYAKTRFGELKQEQAALTEQHAAMLKDGTELLDRYKANPTDRALRNQLEATQRGMEGVQKRMRRAADSLQREMGPSLGLIDKIAGCVRRMAEAEDKETIKRAIKTIIGHVQDLYRAHPALPSSGIIDPVEWERSALGTIDEASDFYDAYGRAGYQAMLALEVMTMSVAHGAPQTAAEATQRANSTVAERLTRVAERFSTA